MFMFLSILCFIASAVSFIAGIAKQISPDYVRVAFSGVSPSVGFYILAGVLLCAGALFLCVRKLTEIGEGYATYTQRQIEEAEKSNKQIEALLKNR